MTPELPSDPDTREEHDKSGADAMANPDRDYLDRLKKAERLQVDLIETQRREKYVREAQAALNVITAIGNPNDPKRVTARQKLLDSIDGIIIQDGLGASANEAAD